MSFYIDLNGKMFEVYYLLEFQKKSVGRIDMIKRQ